MLHAFLTDPDVAKNGARFPSIGEENGHRFFTRGKGLDCLGRKQLVTAQKTGKKDDRFSNQTRNLQNKINEIAGENSMLFCSSFI